tara:strand:+ start:527 stop:1183 length:657 start_codon:yes stop_codon:yes gene_type:complete
MNIDLYPSLLAADTLDLKRSIQSCMDAELTTLHIDIMDMHYVPNLGLNVQVCEQINKDFPKTMLNVHLMTLAPEKIIDRLFNLSIHAIAFHPMTTQNTGKLIEDIQSHGIRAGIAINPFEDIKHFENYLCDYFLVMGVSPGFSGQSFNPSTYDKIRELKVNTKTKDKPIIVDGGVNQENLQQLVRCGVSGCVLGNAIFKNNHITKNILDIQEFLRSME